MHASKKESGLQLTFDIMLYSRFLGSAGNSSSEAAAPAGACCAGGITAVGACPAGVVVERGGLAWVVTTGTAVAASAPEDT